MLGGERLCRRPDSKTELRLARYKLNLRFKNPFCRLASYSKQAYLSSTPRLFQGKSSDGWRLPAPRESHPSEDLSELPPLRAAVAGQEYRPTAYRGHTGSRPVLIADCYSLPAGIADPGAVANVAYAHRNSSGKVPDEWVCDFQGANPFTRIKRRTGERLSVAFHLFPHL